MTKKRVVTSSYNLRKRGINFESNDNHQKADDPSSIQLFKKCMLPTVEVLIDEMVPQSEEETNNGSVVVQTCTGDGESDSMDIESDERLVYKYSKFARAGETELTGELREKWIAVNMELRSKIPDVRRILSEEMSVSDMAKIVEHIELYRHSLFRPDEDTIILKEKINKMIETARKDYAAQAQFSDVIKRQIEDMDKDLSPATTLAQYKHRILALNCSRTNKEAIYKKFQEMVKSSTERDSEDYFKLKRWIDCSLALPYDILCSTTTSSLSQSSFILRARKLLDEELYGMDVVKEQLLLYLNNRISNLAAASHMSLGLVGPSGVGKCFARDTPILLSTGESKAVQDIRVGDRLMGDDGNSERVVVTLAHGHEMMYTVWQKSNGINYTVNESHILSLFSLQRNRIVDLSVREYLALSDEQREDLRGVKGCVYNFSIPGVFTPPYDPYLAGFFWGRALDGSVRFRCDPDDTSPFPQMVLDVVELETFATTLESNMDSEIHRIARWKRPEDEAFFAQARIPTPYLTAPLIERKYLFLGMLDASVRALDDRFKIATYDKNFHDDCVFLARSLGLQVESKCVVDRNMHVVTVHIKAFFDHFSDPPAFRHHFAKGDPIFTYPIKVSRIGVGEYFGFTLSGTNNRFLLGDFTVAHNTKIARCVSKILDVPFEQISLGCVTRPESIRGYDFNFIGSRPGVIVEALKRMKCKNGILYLDEIDKVVPEYQEISAMILNLTDPNTNHNFRDRYLSELDLDLSQIGVVYSMNELPDHPVLRRRMHVIEVCGYTPSDKVEICKQFLFPASLATIGRQRADITFTNEILCYLVNRACPPLDKGLRAIEKAVVCICSKLNFLVTNAPHIDKLGTMSFMLPGAAALSYPVSLSKEIIDTLIPHYSTVVDNHHHTPSDLHAFLYM